MDQSISSLAFKGSIIEAITEAKRQKKLFVVYVSGDNEESALMDKSTWSESSVADSLSKYCILLHIVDGSTDAAQFSALYPQKSAPCITAVGHNGVQLWQNEGFVTAEVLASTLEKTWLSLHVQETTATLLALASRQAAQTTSEAPRIASREIGNSSSSASSSDKNVGSPVDRKDADDNTEKSEKRESSVKEIKPKLHDEVCHGSSVDKPEKSKVEQPDTTTSKAAAEMAISSIDSRVDKESGLNVTNQHGRDSEKTHQVLGDEPRGFVKTEETGSSQIEKANDSDLASNKSNDIHLNIRLPGGVSLKEKFEPTSTLRMVKDYVDENQESSIGRYDLAIPYPRKVFNDQDLNKTLSELNLLDRQALIVVPHIPPRGHQGGQSSLPNQSTSTNATGSSNGEGYFSYVRRILSYVNPFIYLGGAGAANSSTSVQESESSMAPSGSTPQGNFTGSQRSYLVTSNQASSVPSTTRNNQPSTSRFGSNIHTLKHDEDDSNFSGKNAFWNGNSTEYGGDGDKK